MTTVKDIIADKSGAHAAPERDAGLLRLFTCGSVDDGKSTLIGRLLHDSKSLHEDQIEAVVRASERRNSGAASVGVGGAGGNVDLSLLTDGLRAEREQGITIDVAYRYFATARRRFILADTPGHVQYTRNMVTGASTADVAIILIDARHGVIEQTRRHACLAALLGIPRLIVCVNKMDLVAFDRARFEQVRQAFGAFVACARPEGLQNIAERAAITCIPISALLGDNVVDRSANMPWYAGPPLLELLESLPLVAAGADQRARFPVQYVLRPQSDAHHDYRGYAGRLAAGALRVGDDVAVLPGGQRSRIARIHVGQHDQETARAPQSIAIELEDDIDISRGDMIVPADELDAPTAPAVSTDIEATVVWMSTLPLTPGRRVLIKHTTRQVAAVVRSITHRLNVESLAIEHGVPHLALNEIGRVRLRLAAPIVCDPYARCRTTGSFIMIDEHANTTFGAALICEPDAHAALASHPSAEPRT